MNRKIAVSFVICLSLLFIASNVDAKSKKSSNNNISNENPLISSNYNLIVGNVFKCLETDPGSFTFDPFKVVYKKVGQTMRPVYLAMLGDNVRMLKLNQFGGFGTESDFFVEEFYSLDGFGPSVSHKYSPEILEIIGTQVVLKHKSGTTNCTEINRKK